jgi:hypothetical protein
MAEFLRNIGLITCAIVGLVTSGCALYVPTLTPAPLVQQRGQVEAGMAFHPLNQGEAYIAYSPVKHLLVVVNGSKRWNLLNGNYNRQATQGDVGLGWYYSTLADNRWYVGGLIGYGGARSMSRAFGPGTPLKEYQARYSRAYGQVWLMRQDDAFKYGAVLRVTGVRYSQLEFNGQPLQESVPDFYVAPALLMRWGRGAIQGGLQAGISAPLGASFSGKDTDVYASELVGGIGVVFYPHLLRKHSVAP